MQGRAGDLLQRAETGAQASPGGDHSPGTGAEMSAKVSLIMMIVMIMMICRQVVIPTIQCEDLSERSCVQLPNAEETTLDVTACVPVVDKPKCDKVTTDKTCFRVKGDKFIGRWHWTKNTKAFKEKLFRRYLLNL